MDSTADTITDTAVSDVADSEAATDAIVVPGASGTIDTSFGDKGVACYVLKAGGGGVTLVTRPSALIAQPDGKVLLIGHGAGIVLVRFDVNGVLEKEARGPVVPADPGTTDDVPWAAALESDGGIVVGGNHQRYVDGGTLVEPLLARFKADGTLDTGAFSGKAYLLPSYGAVQGAIRALAIVGGKTIVAGSLVDGGGVARAFVARHLEGGGLDTTFGDAGVRTFSFATAGSSYGLTMSVGSDGSLAIGGQFVTSTGSEIGLAHLDANGALDTSFGTGGVVRRAIPGAEGAVSITRQGTGALVIAATSNMKDLGAYAIARFTAAGALDSTFGSAGVIGAGTDVYSSRAVLALPDDALLVGAQAVTDADGGKKKGLFSVERFGKSGAVDATFGTGGRTVTEIIGALDGPSVTQLARQTDGRVLAAGPARGGMCVARYWP